MRIVIWPYSGMPLLLNPPQFKNGRLVGGYVVNGDWTLKMEGDEMFACGRHNTVKNKIPVQYPYKLVIVDSEIRGDYNAVIVWAEEQPCEYVDRGPLL